MTSKLPIGLDRYHQSNFGACTSVNGNEYASEPTPRAQRVEGQRSIQRAFERFNAPQMRRDRQREWLDALPPTWLMLVAGFTCLFTLLIADTLYSAFFRWMVG